MVRILIFQTGAVRSGEFLLLGNHCLHTIVHILDQVNLRAAQSSLVRDIIDMVRGLRVLAVDASDLDVVLIGNSLEFIHLRAKLGQFDVN